MDNFIDQEIFAEDGTYSIIVPSSGANPTVNVEGQLASCEFQILPGPEVGQSSIEIRMETQRDEGFNGCIVTIRRACGDMATITLGYTIDG